MKPFTGIVAERAGCDHCGMVRWVAYIPRTGEDRPYAGVYAESQLQLCAGCIYKLVRLAGTLLRLEAAPKPPKAHRTRTKRAPAAPRADPGPLVPSDYSPVAEVVS